MGLCARYDAAFGNGNRGKIGMAVDFVITWVNSSDPKWQQEKNKYQPRDGSDYQDIRYRDWELLRYWFRGVEKFAPWAGTIHLVTGEELPEWLRTEHPGLHVVRHEDYMPGEILPVFNSNVVELYLDRIEGLSEKFVYFNDDMFLTGPVKESFFFSKGLPCDMLAFQPIVANPNNPVMSHIFLNNTLVLSKYFKKRENVKAQPKAYFHPGYPPLYFFYNLLELLFPKYTGFYTVHGPSPFLKSTFREVWSLEEAYFHKVSANRFRGKEDVSQYLFREWQKLSGHFCPRNVTRQFGYYEVPDAGLCRDIAKGRHAIICINDTGTELDFAEEKRKLQNAFANLLPEKCSFEK